MKRPILLQTCQSLACIVPFLVTAPVQAQDAYPSRPVHVVVTTGAGGTGDIVARLVSDRLSEALKQPFVIENQTAGNGSVAVAQVARAKPDGHTLIFMADSTLTINPHLYKHLTVDPVRELAPVGIAAKMPMVLIGSKGLQANNVTELVALARSNPGKLSYASTGVGTHLHIGFELFKMKTSTDILHVPYRGNTGVLADLMGGRIDMVLIGQPALAGQVATDRIKVIGLAAEKRSALLPDVPTLAERPACPTISSARGTGCWLLRTRLRPFSRGSRRKCRSFAPTNASGRPSPSRASKSSRARPRKCRLR